MTVTDVIARIEKRGFTVQDSVNGNSHVFTVLDANGNSVAWPVITTGKSGNVADVALKSFHGGKVTGLGDYPTAAIYGDIYLRFLGKPSDAEKAIAALIAAPVASVPAPAPTPAPVDPFADVPVFTQTETTPETETMAANA